MNLDALKQALLSLLPKAPASPIPQADMVNDPLARAAAESRSLYGAGMHKIDQVNKRNKQQPGAIEQALSQLTQGKVAPVQGAPVPTPTLAASPDSFEQTALPIMNEYGIPPAIGFGMHDAEGGKIGSNNPYNINAVDSNPQNATNYPTQQAGIEAFAKLIAQDPRYKDAYAQRANPDTMLEAIARAGYAGDPKTWKQRSANTGGAGINYDTYPQFVQNTKGYARYRQQP